MKRNTRKPAATNAGHNGASGHGFAATLGAIGAAGVGAAAMYLLDPQRGAERRHHLAECASDAAHSGWETFRHKAADTSAAIAAAVPSTEEALSYLPRRSHREHHYGTVASMACMSAMAALAVGLGAMWLFDPARGRGRRAWLGQKATRAANETGHFMRATGRHLRNKAQGYYHESRSAVESAARHLTGESGSVEPESSAQQSVQPGRNVAPYFMGGRQGAAPSGA